MADGFDLVTEMGKMTEMAGRAFAVYISSDDRNLVPLGQTLGHSHDTMREWSARYKWRELAQRHDGVIAAGMMGALRSAIVTHAFEAVKVGVSIMQDEGAKDADRLKAAAWIASLGGLGPRSAPALPDVEHGVGAISGDDLRKLADSGNPDDLRRLVKLTTGREGS